MDEVEAGSILGDRYELLEPRATGATATVWAAHDQFLRRRVAVKVLHRQLTADTDLVERFAAEARTAANVNHPCLVAVYDTIATPPAIVLEWVEGPDLRRRLADGPLPADEVVALGAALCAALTALHERGLVHRDVKPANVLLTSTGRPKLTDFGIATANAGDRTATGVVLGTAKYLAPEQVRGERIDGRADVFALACVLYEALTGSPPWERDGDLPTALARLETDPEPITAGPELPAAVADAITRGLARDPHRRWPTAAAFAAGLQGLDQPPPLPPPSARATHDPTPPPPVGEADTTVIGSSTLDPTAAVATARTVASPSRRVRHRRRRWPRIVGAGIVAAIALLGWTLIAGSDDDSFPAGSDGPVGVVAMRTFDPDGTGPAGEHDELVGHAIDGDPTTGWPTERYGARDLGAKAGVGLVLVLDRNADIDDLRVETGGSSDWAADVRVAEMSLAEVDAAADPADFGPVVGGGSGLEATAQLPVSGRGNVVLVWFTDLGAGPLPIRLVVNEITVS